VKNFKTGLMPDLRLKKYLTIIYREAEIVARIYMVISNKREMQGEYK
jgi:hypothetical protein